MTRWEKRLYVHEYKGRNEFNPDMSFGISSRVVPRWTDLIILLCITSHKTN